MNHLVGTVLGQYQLTEVIGRGGMAVVYKAYQPMLDREVAVKVLLHSHDPSFAPRFKREALASARLQHPYILPVYDFGEQDGLLYLVLQYVERGATLDDLLHGPMEPIAALRLIGRVLDALGYAHERGIIHRDIKPANILMRSPVWPLLADFGIAKLVDETGALTQGGLLLGTATYMAPEQASGCPANARTDLYAVGVVLYELLTGRVPFYAPDPVALLHQHAYEPLPPPRSLNPRIPIGVEQFLIRALAKDPDMRFQSAAEMATVLGQLADQLERILSGKQLRKVYEAGAQAFAAERWGAAVEQLDQVVAREPTFEDAAELLDLARAAQDHAKANKFFKRSAVTGDAYKLFLQGQQKERAGRLHGALADYRAVRAVVFGRARDEITARIAVLMARMQREHPKQAPDETDLINPPTLASPTVGLTTARPVASEHFAPSTNVQPSLPPAPLLAAPTIGAARTPILPMDRPQPRSHRRYPVAALALGLALLGGGGIIWASQRRAPAAAPIAVAVHTATATGTASLSPTALATQSTSPSATPTMTPTTTATPTITPSPTVTNTPTPLTPQAITSSRLNLRAGPAPEYAALGTYDTGTVFKLLGKNTAGTWLQVEAPGGRVGWMAAQFLQVNVALSDLPLIEAPPLPTPRPTILPTARPRQAPQPQPTSPPAPLVDTPVPLPAPTDEPKPDQPKPTSPPRREPTSPPRREPTSPPRREPTSPPR